MGCTRLPVPSYQSVACRDVLQGSDSSLLGALTHAAGHKGKVHADSDGAPQPLYALGVWLVLQQGALSLHILQGNSL